MNTRVLHILTTEQFGGAEVRVRFSDGTSAVYDVEELEKLRPQCRPGSERLMEHGEVA